jgi:hypothetical protein
MSPSAVSPEMKMVEAPSWRLKAARCRFYLNSQESE